MAKLAFVTIEAKPAHTLPLYEWPQPFKNGDDTGVAWHAVDALNVTREVQRDRLTDDVYWCSVRADLTGVQGFQVNTGPTTSPSVTWSTPTLTGLGMRWTAAHDGNSIHFADFTDTTTQTVERDGPLQRVVHRYMLSKISAAGTGNQSVGDGILSHHVWLHYRADLPDVVKLDVLIANAAAEVETSAVSIAARGAGIKCTGPTQLNTIGFSEAKLILPAGWAAVSARFTESADQVTMANAGSIPPVAGPITSNAHCFPRKSGTLRRWVIYRTAGATLQQAQDLLAFKGFGRATSDGNRSYHTVRAFGPSKSLLPRLDLGFAGTGGYATATTQCSAHWSNLSAASLAGTTTYGNSDSAEFGSAFFTARKGIFHPIGNSDVQQADGTEIGTNCGALRHVPGFVRFASLYSSHKIDGCGLFLLERTTGKPLRSYDFAAAYAGGAVPGYTGGVAFAGIRQPFTFYCQNNGGYEYSSTELGDFAGWTQRDNSWPPHFQGTSAHESAGFFWMNNKWWPKRTSQWGSPDRTLWSFVCDYRPTLEIVPWSPAPDGATFAGQPVYGTGVSGSGASAPHLQSSPNNTSGQAQCWKDPEDSQHAIRIYRYLIPMAWLGGDLMSIFVFDMVAEWFGLEYTEMGCLDKPANQGDANRALGPVPPVPDPVPHGRLRIQSATPQTARYGMGRGDAWGGLPFAIQFALSSDAKRNEGYPIYGIKARAKMFYDFIRLGVITLNGMTDRLHSVTGITSPYVPTGNIPTNMAFMQAGNELPKLYFTYFSLFKQLDGVALLPQSSIDQSQAHFITAWQHFVALTSQYTDYTPSPGIFAPYDFVATWNDTTNLPVPGEGAPGGPLHSGVHWNDCLVHLECAYRVLGDEQIWACANSLGAPVAAGTPHQTRAVTLLNSDSYYGPTVMALMQQAAAGADEGFTAPSIAPQIQATAVTNPVIQGGTTIIRAVVTPGLNPTSLTYSVTASLPASLGGGTLTLLDDGVSPDGTAGDLRFNVNLPTVGQPVGAHNILAQVIDDQNRSDGQVLTLNIGAAATNPSIPSFTGSPSPVVAGSTLTIFVTVTPGTSPTSSGITVAASPTGMDIARFNLLDDGVAPDVTGADLVFTGSCVVPADLAPGTYKIPLSVLDAQGRTAAADLTIPVVEVPVPTSGPQIVASALSSPILAGGTLTLYGTVVAGDSPIISVTADTSALGGPVALPLLDDGVAPDVTAADSIYSGEYVTSGGLAAGDYAIPITVLDKANQTDTDTLTLTVLAVVDPTDPLVTVGASPNPVVQLSTCVLSADVTPGTAPASSSIAVVVNLASVGGSATQAMTNTSGNHWEYSLVTTLAMLPGEYGLKVTMSDAQLRSAEGTIPLVVSPFVPVPTNAEVFLPVFEEVAESLTGPVETLYKVELDGSERLIVYDESDVPYVIESSPDASATNGGQLPVTDTDNVTVYLVPFTVIVEPVVEDPEDPPDPPEEPVPVVIGAATGGERVGRRVSQLEAVGAG